MNENKRGRFFGIGLVRVMVALSCRGRPSQTLENEDHVSLRQEQP